MPSTYWRDKRDHDWLRKLHNSKLCMCGTRVWNFEKECRTCGTENSAYRPKVKAKEPQS